jgi:hypothetical protein
MNTVQHFHANDMKVEHSFFDIPLEKIVPTYAKEMESSFLKL